MPPRNQESDEPLVMQRSDVYSCPNCHKALPRDAEKCRSCGWTPLYRRTMQETRWHRFKKAIGLAPEPTPCPDCDSWLPPSARVCIACGWTRPLKRTWLRKLLTTASKPVKQHFKRRRVCPVCLKGFSRDSQKCRHCGWMPENWDATRTETGLWVQRTTKRLRAFAAGGIASVKALLPASPHYLMPCPICEAPLPSNARKCRRCQWVQIEEPATQRTLRRRIVHALQERRLRRHGDLKPCPNCEEWIAVKAKKCNVCGWTPNYRRTPLAHRLPLVGFWLERRRKKEDLGIKPCPYCNVLLPSSGKLCLACGWTQPLEKTLINRLRVGLVQGVQRARARRRPIAEACPECDTMMPRGTKKCLVCGWTSLPQPAEIPRAVKSRGNYVLCPSCCEVIARKAGQCDRCGWTPQQRAPRRAVAWAMLAASVVGLSMVLVMVLMQMAEEGAGRAGTPEQMKAQQKATGGVAKH
jgi:ribosomal protein L40E